jgi:hypothetical protein
VRDAGHLRTVHVHADAAVRVAVVPKPDAPPVVQGTAYLMAKHKDHYLNIMIDGKFFKTTPQLNKHPIPAGHHSFELLEPDSGAVVVHRDVDLTDGQTFTLEP